jgi:eukaryotic-like serine/threonine-protein kinase
VVYLARDVELEREVAVKLLHPHLAARTRAEACARFFDEARVAASLRHPNIVAILDMDERARRIVMELAAGGTLRRVLGERGPRPMRRALERHAQILSALAAAHRRGVVHRDLKPGNLMFRRDPDAPGAEIVLGDFGVAHLPDERGAIGVDAARERRPAEAVGTLAYMAPEQRRGEAVAASDLYAAAVVLYEMLAGQAPWPRDVLLSGVRRETDLTLPADATGSGPPALLARVQRHLLALSHPDPTARPDTEAALIEAQDLRDHAIADA